MPTLDQHVASKFAKVLILGEGGSGKTALLASAARAGYSLFILDFDNGLTALRNHLIGETEALKRITFETLRDKLKTVNGQLVMDGPPQGMSRAMALLTDWPGKGRLETWTEKDILVIDSLTFMGMASLRQIAFLVGREGKLQQQDWGAAMDQVEKALALLTSPACNCNVVVNTHVNWVESEGGGAIRGLPMALGQKLSPKVGTYFDNVLLVKTMGSGETRKRTLVLGGEGLIEGKAATLLKKPLEIKPGKDDTALVDFFKLVKGA